MLYSVDCNNFLRSFVTPTSALNAPTSTIGGEGTDIVFVDPDFPPTATSQDGRRRRPSSCPASSRINDDDEAEDVDAAKSGGDDHRRDRETDAALVLCRCGLEATPRTVQSEGPNYGRFYLICGQHHNNRVGAGRRKQQERTRQRHQPKASTQQHQHQQRNQTKEGDDSNNRNSIKTQNNEEDRSMSRASKEHTKIVSSDPGTAATTTTTQITCTRGDESITTVNPTAQQANTERLILRNPYANKTKQQQQRHDPPLAMELNPNGGSYTLGPCSFFRWDDDGSAGAASLKGYQTHHSRLTWYHFGPSQSCCLYKNDGTRAGSTKPASVARTDKRGRMHPSQVENCWFLSALVVVAERSFLLDRVVPHDRLNEHGCYQVNLCLNGAWTPILIDSYLPVIMEDTSCTYNNKNIDNGNHRSSKSSPSSSKRKSQFVKPSTVGSKRTHRGGVWVHKGDDVDEHEDMREGARKKRPGASCLYAWPAFCATPDGQLWAAFVEKAYAKAHGSYARLSGGYIAEAMQDLTGAPTETIVFSDPLLNHDAVWERLLGYHEAGHVMGVATARGGDGLVGGHAYSLLQVLQVDHAVIGEQAKVTDYFNVVPTCATASDALATTKSALIASCDRPFDQDHQQEGIMFPTATKVRETKRSTLR